MRKVKISDLKKKFKFISRTTMLRAINSGKIESEFSHNSFFVDEDCIYDLIGIKKEDFPENFNEEYFKLSELSKEIYRISLNLSLVYKEKGKLRGFNIFDKWFFNKEDYKKIVKEEIERKEKLAKTKKKNEELFDSILGDEYIRLDPFVALKKKVRVLHKKCNKISLLTPDNTIFRGCQCPYCYGTKLYTLDEVKEKIERESNGFYKYHSGDYRSNKSDIYIIHTYEKCKGKGKPFKTRLNTFLTSGAIGCPYCSMSSGEEKIFNFLLLNNIDFSFQERAFPGKRKYFRFDFKIQEKNLFIEFDGKQHFEPIMDWNFEAQKERDIEKNDYVLENNLKMIRISYKNFDNLEEILREILLEETFRDYPLGEYEQVFGNSAILKYKSNILFIG